MAYRQLTTCLLVDHSEVGTSQPSTYSCQRRSSALLPGNAAHPKLAAIQLCSLTFSVLSQRPRSASGINTIPNCACASSCIMSVAVTNTALKAAERPSRWDLLEGRLVLDTWSSARACALEVGGYVGIGLGAGSDRSTSDTKVGGERLSKPSLSFKTGAASTEVPRWAEIRDASLDDGRNEVSS
jgi:hypothetical protein